MSDPRTPLVAVWWCCACAGGGDRSVKVIAVRALGGRASEALRSLDKVALHRAIISLSGDSNYAPVNDTEMEKSNVKEKKECRKHLSGYLKGFSGVRISRHFVKARTVG